MKVNFPVSKPHFIGPMNEEQLRQHNELRVFLHHIYEYKKGLRNLILTTEKSENREFIENRLSTQNIPYLINPIGDKTINVFFGDINCIDVISTLDTRLNKLSPEQDFMLGTLLGYDKTQQCKRYMDKIAPQRYSA